MRARADTETPPQDLLVACSSLSGMASQPAAGCLFEDFLVVGLSDKKAPRLLYCYSRAESSRASASALGNSASHASSAARAEAVMQFCFPDVDDATSLSLQSESFTFTLTGPKVSHPFCAHMSRVPLISHSSDAIPFPQLTRHRGRRRSLLWIFSASRLAQRDQLSHVLLRALEAPVVFTLHAHARHHPGAT